MADSNEDTQEREDNANPMAAMEGFFEKLTERVMVQVDEKLKAGAERTTTEADTDVSGTSADALKRENERRVPALTAGRTQPTQFADWRYACMPEWERKIRTPANDMEVHAFLRAHNTLIQTGNGKPLEAINERLKKQRADLLEGDSTGGAPFDGTAGQLLPLPVSTYVNVARYRRARFLSLVRQNTASLGASLRISFQDLESTSEWEGEGDAIAAGEGRIQGALNLQLQKLASRGLLSNELLEDEIFNVVAWLLGDMAPQMAAKEDKSLYSTGLGVASNQPNGFELNDVIVTATTTNTNIVPQGALQVADHFVTTFIDEDSISDLFYAVSEPERMEGVFAGPDTVMQIIGKIKDGSGRPIFDVQTNPQRIVGDAESGGQVGSIFGRPLVNLPGVEGTSNSNENRLYFFNPLRTYATLEKPGTRVESSRDSRFDTDKTEFRFIRRVDGGVIGNKIPGAFQYRFLGGIKGAGTPEDA